MSTVKLYDTDAYIKEFEAKILSCEKTDEGSLDIILDKTAFFPEAGGQSADTGTIEGIKI